MCLCFWCVSARATKIKLIEGNWKGILTLSPTANLPFDVRIKILDKTKQLDVHIINGKEDIALVYTGRINDSIKLEFPAFATYLILKPLKNSRLEGYWVNPNKTNKYRIPCFITYGSGKRFEHPALYQSSVQPADVQGKWETTFEAGTPDSTKAVGIFQQRYNEISGTFLTETGDYRYLEGNVVSDSLFLSTFDGSHAFLFKARINKNSVIQGDFYSGKHWSCKWVAFKNNSFELAHPDSLTYLTKSEPFTLQIKPDSEIVFQFPNQNTKNKVVILQIMGTWCPNCMDESRFFKELYQKYHSQGLEIYALCYESGSDVNIQKQRIATFIERMRPGYEFILAGTANKGVASQHFKMLNQVMSFPTAIIIGKDGEVKRIHTGFNGPGTGVYYTEYTKEMDVFIQDLLKN
jgi:thiol-disulfide isomerase/thioredoxin